MNAFRYGTDPINRILRGPFLMSTILNRGDYSFPMKRFDKYEQ